LAGHFERSENGVALDKVKSVHTMVWRNFKFRQTATNMPHNAATLNSNRLPEYQAAYFFNKTRKQCFFNGAKVNKYFKKQRFFLIFGDFSLRSK